MAMVEGPSKRWGSQAMQQMCHAALPLGSITWTKQRPLYEPKQSKPQKIVIHIGAKTHPNWSAKTLWSAFYVKRAK